jgi:rhodanese-related sulfurtransferase/CBS-domain-containing membrane protein
MSSPQRIGWEDVQRLMSHGAQVVDALLPEDYNSRHLPGAINIPLRRVNDEIRRLDRSRPVVVYCADNECDLSPRLAARLAAEGFAEVYDYVAGFDDWSARGLPIEGDDAEVATAGALARTGFPTCSADEPLASIVERFADHILCAVVDEDGVLLGRLARDDVEERVREGAREMRARDVMHPGPSTFRPDVPIAEMARWFADRDVHAFIITTPDGRPLGILYAEDVERVVQEAHRRHEEHARR